MPATFRLFVVAAGLVAASGALLHSQSPEFAPFDPARIGLPALTDQGIDYLIEQYRQLVDKARSEIAQLRQGGLSNTDELIARYQEDIRNALEQVARLAGQRTQAAQQMASGGRAADLAPLQAAVTTVLEASRFHQLSGEEDVGLAEWKKAVDVVTTFSSNFAQKCFGQSFDPGIALGMNRQNELLDTGIDLLPCAKRRYTINAGTVSLKNCSIWGEGTWEVTRTGTYQGSGTAELTRGPDGSLKGPWNLRDSGGALRRGDQKGELSIKAIEERDSKGHLVKREVRATVTFDDDKLSGGSRGRSVRGNITNEATKEFPVEMSPNPCRDTKG